MNYGISNELNNDIYFFPDSHKNIKKFDLRCYCLSYLHRTRSANDAVKLPFVATSLKREESDCGLQHSVMLCFRILCVCLASILLVVGGQCPAQCECPSSQVANCASLALKNIPTERCVEYTSSSRLKYRLVLGVCK